MRNIMLALRQITEENRDVELVYPLHLSPVVREAADQYLRGAVTPLNGIGDAAAGVSVAITVGT